MLNFLKKELLLILVLNFVFSQNFSATPSDANLTSITNLRGPIEQPGVLPARPLPVITDTNLTLNTSVLPITNTTQITITNTTSSNVTTPAVNTTIPVVPVVVPVVLNTTNVVSSTNNTDAAMHAIPSNFFVDKSGGNSTKEFIVLQNKNKKIITCNTLGNLTVTKGSINQDNLWLPIKSSIGNYFNLRSYWGGYLTLVNNTNFNCANRNIDSSNDLLITKEADNLITLKFKDAGYIGIDNLNVTLIKDRNNSTNFYPVF